MKLKSLFVAGAVAGLALLGGCVAVPVAGPGYYEPAPYYAPPAYYGPSVGIGVYGGGYYRGHRHGRWR